MSDENKLEKLDPELEKLLDAERAAVPASAAIERVWARVIGVAPLSPGGHGGGGIAAGTSVAGTGWLASHAVGVGLAMVVAGSVTGAGLYVSGARKRPPPERPVVHVVSQPSAPAAAPAEPPAPPAVVLAAPTPSTATAPPPTSPPSHAPAHAAPSPVPSSLAVEQLLLDDARRALSSHDADQALALLDEHERRFPQGQLSEEREALGIQALVALGRYDDARTRAVRFRAATPRSLFLPAIETSLGSIP